MNKLTHILQNRFGFKDFRPHQENVCRSVTEGEDVLLVMPTGAGKSLCYQLPGIARGGVTIVISPLIALMEDQVAKLKAMGFVAERIHSGRTRPESRQVCRNYLDEKLDFLFIAPERLGVPGFPEMLAKRVPALIAIDEAHCISHWGHDFRPDYRLLGERLPLLGKVPLIAMTATATPLVQEDIVKQLDMPDCKRFIHGFRRTNIAIEVIETSNGERSQLVEEILSKDEARPAIVYAPTRKKTEELASDLSTKYKSAAYHAGMLGEKRDAVQRRFQAGELEVIVATIAFGMGIDKSDIRSVIHTALPSSLEAYYQEIGRAGRDGKISKAVLLHSYSDRSLQLFLHEKSYPEAHVLELIYSTLGENWRPANEIMEELGLEEREFAAALDKLWIHGGAIVSPEENIKRGNDSYIKPYREQRQHRLEQLDDITSYAKEYSCRMLQLVKHFGDQSDGGETCKLCDFCNPSSSIAGSMRPPEEYERLILVDTLNILKDRDQISIGGLHKELGRTSGISRADFDKLLEALIRAGMAELEEHSFEKGGRTIHYRRVDLTGSGYKKLMANDLSEIKICGEACQSRKPARRSLDKSTQTAQRRKKREPADTGIFLKQADPQLFATLKEYRLQEARKRSIPAWRVFTNDTLQQLSSLRPTDEEALLSIYGIGPSLVKNHGEDILQIVRSFDEPA